MKKKVLFFITHLLLVLLISLHSFFNQMDFENKNLLVLKLNKIHELMKTPVLYEYVQFAGIDSGYGFYGGDVATSKFFIIELRDQEEEVVFSGEFKKLFESQNTYVRFETLMSKLYNTMIDLDELREELETQENEDLQNFIVRQINLQEKWIDTIYKSLEKFVISHIKTHPQLYEAAVYGCISYRTILPPDKLSTYFKDEKHKNPKEVVKLHQHNFYLEKHILN